MLLFISILTFENSFFEATLFLDSEIVSHYNSWLYCQIFPYFGLQSVLCSGILLDKNDLGQ